MKITFADAYSAPKDGTLAVVIEEGRKLPPAAQDVDRDTGGSIGRALKAARFTGKKNEIQEILAPANVDYARILLLGIGKEGEMGRLDWQTLGGKVVGHLNSVGEKAATIQLDAGADDLSEAAAELGFGATLAGYRFEEYFTKRKPEEKASLARIALQAPGAKASRKRFKDLTAVADGVFFTRDLVSEPPNVLYPESFAKRCGALEELGVKVDVLGEKEMKKLGMGALLGVGQGSSRESKLVVMRWDGAAKNKRPVAFVGKGVTFDTGGISLKPGPGMEEMKWDMGGAGVVTGLMKALAGRKAKANIVGVIGLVENMPDGNAQRPGDVVTTMAGKTVEIHNTDAEGRLVLADALTYTQKEYKPQVIVDLATLTGAIIIALGHEHAGLFSNDDDLADKLLAAGRETDEKVWRLPLGDAYDKQLKSDCADMKNIGGRPAGSITAAQFLQRFIEDTPWAHLDIAGVAWSSKEKPTVPKGATGFGVRLLDRYVAENYG